MLHACRGRREGEGARTSCVLDKPAAFTHDFVVVAGEVEEVPTPVAEDERSELVAWCCHRLRQEAGSKAAAPTWRTKIWARELEFPRSACRSP